MDIEEILALSDGVPICNRDRQHVLQMHRHLCVCHGAALAVTQQRTQICGPGSNHVWVVCTSVNHGVSYRPT